VILTPSRLLTVLLLSLAAAATAAAGDWPQILGPGRNGIANDEKLAERWPADGPKVLWQREAGSGFAGVAVAGGKCVLFHRIGDEELAEGLDAATGRGLWKAAFPTRFMSTFSRDHGPRCVPLIHKDRVYLCGASGNLHCVTLDEGRPVWTVAAFKDFAAPDGYFGAGSSPIVAGDKLLMNVGGDRQGAGIVAFALDSGKVLWKATANQASYSSPLPITVDGVPQVIFVTRLQTLSLDPDNGRVHWSFRFGAPGPTVNAANPVVINGRLFLTASYGIGAVYAQLGKSPPEILWSNDDVLSSQFTTPVAKDGYLYGIDGREDQGEAELRCLDPQSGKVVWSKAGLGKGSLILADGKLLLQSTSGKLHLAEASPEGYRELAAAEVTSAKAFALPALAGGRLYVRGPKELKCLAVGR